MKNQKIIKSCTLLLGSFFLLSNILIASTVKEQRNVGTFNGISLSIPAVLYLTQGDENTVFIEGDQKVLEKIVTEVKKDQLNIQFENWYNYKGVSSLKVFITLKEVESLSVTGSGDIVAQSPLRAEKLSLVVSGSGDIQISELTTQKVSATISGSGDISIQGNNKAQSLKAVVTGSGDFVSDELTFNEGDLTITGSGTIHASVADKLSALITGSGKIYYDGNPLIDATINGSGKIRNSNK
ncbi:MAG: head GIN domain-containing protein [Bacteroidales bacterium]|jgi:hypothetical protein|nr:head GIN domain-containing protein [Bacteroidales bacterium]